MNQNKNMNSLKFDVMVTSKERRTFVVTPAGAKRISELKSDPAITKEKNNI